MRLIRLCTTDEERAEDRLFVFTCGHRRVDDNIQINRWNRKGRLVEWVRCRTCHQINARKYTKRTKG